MKISSKLRSASLLGAAAAVISIGLAASAAAQAPDAADRCTSDVMRLCNEYIPDADRIVVCLKAKRKQISPDCLKALNGGPTKGRKRLKDSAT